MRKRRNSLPILLRTVTAIAGLASLIFFASFAKSTSYGAPECLAWPDGIDSGQTHVTYRITKSCEIDDVRFLISEPPGAFDEAALCMARASHYYGPTPSGRMLSEDEAQAELDNFREMHPERYHDRSIFVKTEDGMDAQITCYFNENWQPTEAEIHYYMDNKFHDEPFSDFDSLPIQHQKRKWELEK